LIGSSTLILVSDAQRARINQRKTPMSKFKAKTKTAPVVATPVVAAPPVAPVATQGKTIVAIARELKITPQNARRLARQHAADLGHANRNDRWLLSPDQEKVFVQLATAPKVAKTVAA
jgi:hypothetical protein